MIKYDTYGVYRGMIIRGWDTIAKLNFEIKYGLKFRVD
jgi:hypothetical protein